MSLSWYLVFLFSVFPFAAFGLLVIQVSSFVLLSAAGAAASQHAGFHILRQAWIWSLLCKSSFPEGESVDFTASNLLMRTLVVWDLLNARTNLLDRGQKYVVTVSCAIKILVLLAVHVAQVGSLIV